MNDTQKYGKPFVRRLNRHFTWRMFWLLIKLNILITVIVCAWLIIKSETIMRIAVNSEFNGHIQNVRVIQERTDGGIVFPVFIQTLLPLNIPESARAFSVEPPDDNMPVSSWRRLVYRINFEENDRNIVVSYYFEEDLSILLFLGQVLLVLELLILIISSIKGRRRISIILKPIYDMASTARNIAPQPDMPVVGRLAGEISSIDARELKRRISVEDAPKELRPLAEEINALLDRISDAYASQIRFVSDASHELRTPISVIQGYADLLDRWGKSDEKTLDESIAAIKSEAYSMKNLVEQLLFLARGENDTLQLAMSDVEVCGLVSEIIREMQIIDQCHIFEAKIPDSLITIRADRDLIKQALRILLENSVKYSPEGEIITVSVSFDNDTVSVCVQDNGMGIAADSLPHIFERFYRSEQSRARKTGGTGLGLSIAKLIADRHSFTLSILSRLNIGTRATITAKKIS